jgi:hypothetical protein
MQDANACGINAWIVGRAGEGRAWESAHNRPVISFRNFLAPHPTHTHAFRLAFVRKACVVRFLKLALAPPRPPPPPDARSP